MINALGAPQSLLLLGGTSDIALAIARRYGHAGLRIVLAARPSDRRSAAATELKGLGCDVTEVDLDARDHESHAATIELAVAGGDIDVAVRGGGLVGEAEQARALGEDTPDVRPRPPDHALPAPGRQRPPPAEGQCT